TCGESPEADPQATEDRDHLMRGHVSPRWKLYEYRAAHGWVLLLLAIVLLEPGFPTDGTAGLLRAGIATLAQGAGCFARQEDRDDGTVHSTLPEPDPRQLSRGINLRAAHIRQATGGASLDDLTETSGHFLLCH